METKDLKELIQTLNSTSYAHIEIKHEGTYIVLDKGTIIKNETMSMDNSSQTLATKSENTEVNNKEIAENYKEIKSPIVGTFYVSSSPDAPAYVKVGDKVKKGDILCIIEAMKLMNEIESDTDGEIVEILVQNEAPVEYGQVLFKIQ